MTTFCNHCEDLVHIYVEHCDIPSSVLNMLLSIHVFIFILLYCCCKCPNPVLIKQLLMIGTALYVMCYVLSNVTQCQIKPNGYEKIEWNMVVYRVMCSLLITFFLFKLNIPSILKLSSVFITLSLAWAEIVSHRHYTSDIIITTVLTYLSIQAFCSILK